MILLDEIFTLFEWLATQNTYIQHTLNSTGKANRFARYRTEALTKQNSNLGSPRLEVRELPHGNLQDGNGWERDKAVFTLRVIYDTTKFKVDEEVAAHDNAKRALMELFGYLFNAGQACEDCNDLICLFDLNSVKYQWIDKATLSGDWLGVQATIELKRGINWDDVTYGPRPDYTSQVFNSWLHGDGIPDSGLGIDGDFYLVDDNVNAPYYRKVNGAWVFQRNLKGVDGTDGSDADVSAIEGRLDTIEAWAAADITGTQVTNWDAAYGWGNHASAGYLTAETDPVFNASAAHGISGADITHWNSAYGWGNHASAGYELQSQKGQANGYAPLDAASKLPAINLPDIHINSLVAANGAATINNADNMLEWQWNTLAASGLKLSSASTAAAGGAQRLLQVALSGANATSSQTTYGSYVTNTHTGTSSTNVAGYFSASGATNNYGLIVAEGLVGIGTATPTANLDIQSAVGQNATIRFQDADVSNVPIYAGFNPAMTSRTIGLFCNNSGTLGGMQLIGFTSSVGSAGSQPMVIRGVHGAASPTVAAVIINCQKASGTSFASLAATEKAMEVLNNGTSLITAFGNGNISIGLASATAALHIKGGTATANTAPLKFTSGTNLTTAEAGAMEYNGTNLFFTRAGTTRENVVCASAVNSVSPTAPDRTLTVNINGTIYYLHAKTTND